MRTRLTSCFEFASASSWTERMERCSFVFFFFSFSFWCSFNVLFFCCSFLLFLLFYSLYSFFVAVFPFSLHCFHNLGWVVVQINGFIYKCSTPNKHMHVCIAVGYVCIFCKRTYCISYSLDNRWVSRRTATLSTGPHLTRLVKYVFA